VQELVQQDRPAVVPGNASDLDRLATGIMADVAQSGRTLMRKRKVTAFLRRQG